MHHVIVMEPVAKALGEILSRAPLLKVLNRLYQQLGSHAQRWRRTIADLEGAEHIQAGHLSEASGYRSLDRKLWRK